MSGNRLLAVGVLASIAACANQSRQEPAKPDSGKQPALRVVLETPLYAATSVAPTTSIGVSFIAAGIDLDTARKKVQQALVMEDYPAQKPIMGVWSFQSWSERMTFQPDVPLVKGDYVVRVPSADPDIVVFRRPYNVFRVGSALRLAEIELLADKGAPAAGLVHVKLRFSEDIQAKEAVTTLVQTQVGAQWSNKTSVASSQTAVKMTTPIESQTRIRVSISSTTLDGKWTGVAGSGAVVAEFVPKDYEVEPGQVLFPVPPDLAIELPSGLKKPSP